ALSDDSFLVRREVAGALARVTPLPRHALAPLLRAIEFDNDPDVCRWSTFALGRLGDPAVPGLGKLLRHESGDVRFHAARSLAEMGPAPPPPVAALAAGREARDEEGAAAAATTLGHVGKPAVPALLAALKSRSAEVRRLGALGLRGTGAAGKEAVKPL